ncbi:hypothetical protein Lesp02_79800 [Lentzea sp. NBRC 105346]|nr:hypothetical protein Lesp02_79800 [Lentzea sp. NBRC 105346]
MKRFWPWLRLLLAVAVLAALAWKLGTGAFVDGLRAINAWSVLAALGIGFATTVLSAWRWSVVAHNLGLPLSLRTAVADYYRGLFLNSVLPAGVLGDVHRAVNHGQQSGDVGRGVRAVVFERFAGQIVLIVVGVGVLLTQRTLPVDLVPSRETVLTALVVLGVMVTGAAMVGRVRQLLTTTWLDARAGLFSRHALPRVTFSSAATIAGHIAMFYVAARVAGSEATLAQLVPLFVLALLVMAVPINIGGFGPREAFLAVAFGASGLGAAQGVTTAVVYGVLAMIASLPGAVTLFRKRSVPDVQVVAEGVDERGEQVLALAGGGERGTADHAGLGVRPHALREQEPARPAVVVAGLVTGPEDLRVRVQEERDLELAGVHVLVGRGLQARGLADGLPVLETGEERHAAA